nr:uncharacterized mitochondrial protein AtMg00810-like [Tanacetum cinerariifolium]
MASKAVARRVEIKTKQEIGEVKSKQVTSAKAPASGDHMSVGIEVKQDMSATIVDTKADLFLDQLQVDVIGTVVVMIYRKWDVKCSNGPLFEHGCCRGIYSIKKFRVHRNKEEYRIQKNDVYMIEFDGATSIHKAFVKDDGFVRYPFRYITYVRRTNLQKIGSRNLDFYLANHMISNVRTRKGWNFSSCGSENCKKGATRKLGEFWLELDITDDTANAVVVMFDDPATTLVGCSAKSVMEDDDEGVVETTSSSILDAEAATESPKLKSLTRDPSVPTPSKPSEERQTKRMIIEDSDAEDNYGSAEGGTRKKDRSHSNKKRRIRLVFWKLAVQDVDAQLMVSRIPSTPTYVHAEENNDNQAEEEHLPDDEFTNPFCEPTQEVTESSSHDIVQTRRQRATDPEMCMFALIVSTAEPKNIKEIMVDSAWIEAMQEELHQFDRLQVSELVDKPFGKSVIRLKWLWKNKKDEDQTLHAWKLFGFCRIRITQVFSNLSDGRENGISQWSTERGGLQIHQSLRGIFINQAKYTLEILHKHGMDKGQSVGTSMARKPKLDADLSGNPVNQTDYRSKIGSLVYLTSSRPNIVQAVCFCARYQSRPTEKHLKKVKRIFRYLRGTVNMGLWYPKGSSFDLIAFLNADHAGCIDTRKSTSGGIQFLCDKLVSWISKKQNCTAMSSAEAECVALSASCAQVMWMRTQLQDYGFDYNKIPLYCDSHLAIAISCNPVQHSRTKHIHTRYHFIKEQVENVLRYDEDECDKGRMPTKIELTLEQSQQGVSNDVLVSIEGVEELKRNVWINGENKAALPILKAETRSIHMLSVFTKMNYGIDDKRSWT